MTPNPLLVDTGTPPIPEAKAWLKAYDGGRGPAIDLSQAAPGHAPPTLLLEALARAAAEPETARYGPIRGEDGLREAYALDMSRAYGGAFKADDSVIVSGCNQAFILSVLAVAKSGDAVMLPYPWYFNHKMALDMLGIATIPLPCRAENGFAPDPEEAESRIDGRTRALVLVTPNNPTGAVYPKETIAAFSRLASKHGIWLVLDETYRDFLPVGQARPHGLFDSGAPDHLISLYSFSKAYSIPGYRLGAMMASARLMPHLAKALDTVQICPPRIGQIALGRTMPLTLDWRETKRAEIAARAAAFQQAVARSDAWEIGSVGAYFAYVRPKRSRGDAVGTARDLALRNGVLALPGSYFGPEQEDWLRVAFANADESQLSMLGDRLETISQPQA